MLIVIALILAMAFLAAFVAFAGLTIGMLFFTSLANVVMNSHESPLRTNRRTKASTVNGLINWFTKSPQLTH